MTTKIRDILTEKVHVDITPDLVQRLNRFVVTYESTGTNLNAFASPYLGLYQCLFTERNKDDFFDLFDVDGKDFASNIVSNSRDMVFGFSVRNLIPLLKKSAQLEAKDMMSRGFTTSDMKKIINSIPTIDKSFKVVSDPFNLFCTYVVHCFAVSKLSNDLKLKGETFVLKILQYKYFTSLVNHRFPYKPNEATMQATFEQLTAKFDIKRYGTWKLVMEARVADMLAPDSIHRKTIDTFVEDKDVLYFMTDFQTRIRNQINIFVEEYMRVKETNDTFGSYSTIGTDNETGESRYVEQETQLDTCIQRVYADCLSVSRFLDDAAIRITASLFTAVNNTQIRNMLIGFSEYATKKIKENKKSETKEQDDTILLLGPYIFIDNVVRQTYRYCGRNGIDTNKPILVIKAAKNVYSSSRISDQSILNIKATVNVLIQQIQYSTRETTVSALKIALIVYIILVAIKAMK